MDISSNFLYVLLLRLPGILLGLTVHEYAHGYVAWLKGDNTANSEGRLSFNPLHHLDLFGTLMICFGPFGWAKPVPVNTRNLDNPKRDMVYVGAAGPVSNIIIALLLGLFLRFFLPYTDSSENISVIYKIIGYAFYTNLGLAFFNLLPVPPLDGSNILIGLLPYRNVISYLHYMRHAPTIFYFLLMAEWLNILPLFSMIIDPFWIPFFKFWQFIFIGGNQWQFIIFGGRIL